MIDENKPVFTVSQFPEGYGKFPYISMRVHYAIYMQVPIHLIPEGIKGDCMLQRGTHLTNVPWEDFKIDLDQRIKNHHGRLVALTMWCKEKVETERKKHFNWCLVEAPDRCYYFEGNEMIESDSPPSGGTLLTQENKIIAMNRKHWVE